MTTQNDMKKYSACTPMFAGIFAMIILLVGIVVWGSMTRIAGAIVASGTLQVASLRQVVQHPDGGAAVETLPR